MKITVFLEKDNAMLFSSRDLQQPTLIGYIYEYEMDEKAVEYWKTVNPEARKALVTVPFMKKKMKGVYDSLDFGSPEETCAYAHIT